MKTVRLALRARIIAVLMPFALFAAAAGAEDKTVALAAGDVPAAVLTVPSQAKIYSNPPKTTIVASGMFLSIWDVPNAANAADALALVAATIQGDVLQFQAVQTNALTVADAPAFHLIGTGVEADDGDPSTADVVVFAVGGHAFMACVHGEHNDASRERDPMLAALQTVRAP